VRTQVVFVREEYKNRPTRRVNAENFGDQVGKRAEAENDWIFDIALALPWMGETSTLAECALVIASPLGLAVVFMAQTRGSHPTLRSAANKCGPRAGDLWDDRVGKERRQAAIDMLKKRHADYWNEMETLGAMAND